MLRTARRKTPGAERAGTATLGRQDLADGRADQLEEVRGPRPPCGDYARPLPLHVRAALPSDALLTTRVALV